MSFKSDYTKSFILFKSYILFPSRNKQMLYIQEIWYLFLCYEKHFCASLDFKYNRKKEQWMRKTKKHILWNVCKKWTQQLRNHTSCKKSTYFVHFWTKLKIFKLTNYNFVEKFMLNNLFKKFIYFIVKWLKNNPN